jgi:GMP reductase
MESVINADIAKWLSENDYFYIMHRFGNTCDFVERANHEKWKTISISVGVKDEDRQLIAFLYENAMRIDYVTIDVAQGHHLLVKEMIAFLNDFKSFKIIAGNVATPEAVRDLTYWGADACKVGVGGGSPCSTKNMTGFHIPMFSCVKDCVKQGGDKIYHSIDPSNVDYFTFGSTSIPIVADGGVRENGDITKALVAGATLIMAGSMFAACIDAPGESNYKSGVFLGSPPKDYKPLPFTKRYHGSASFRQKNENRHVEGFEIELPCNGLTYEQKYQEIRESLSSAMSYGGATKLSDLRNVEWVEIKA